MQKESIFSPQEIVRNWRNEKAKIASGRSTNDEGKCRSGREGTLGQEASSWEAGMPEAGSGKGLLKGSRENGVMAVL